MDNLKTITKNLESDIMNENNYYFFNEAENSKKVTLNFYSNYSEEFISEIILYYDGTVVSDRVKIIDTSIHDAGIFVMELEEYVPKFNEVKLITDQDTELYLKTGLYSFEKVNIIDNLPEKDRWNIKDYHITENVSLFTFDSNFDRESISDTEYEIILPELAISELLIEKKLEINESDNDLHLIIETDSSKEFNCSSSYEILVTQKKTGHKEQYIMNSIIVAINP